MTAQHRTHTHIVSVEWGHCDPASIVFYPNFFTWMDQATRHLFESAGLGWQTLVDEFGVVGLPLVDARAEFVSPVRFGDVLEVTTHVGEWRRKTLVVAHEITNAGRLAVKGEEIRAWVAKDPDSPTGLKAKPIPEAVRQQFVSVTG